MCLWTTVSLFNHQYIFLITTNTFIYANLIGSAFLLCGLDRVDVTLKRPPRPHLRKNICVNMIMKPWNLVHGSWLYYHNFFGSHFIPCAMHIFLHLTCYYAKKKKTICTSAGSILNLTNLFKG